MFKMNRPSCLYSIVIIPFAILKQMLYMFDKGGTQPIVERGGTSKKGGGLASKRGHIEGWMTL